MQLRLVMLACVVGVCLAGSGNVALAGGQVVGAVCKVTPFQATTTALTPSGSVGLTRMRVTISLPGKPSLIQFFSIRYNNSNSTVAIFNSAQVTVTLSGRPITHGIEIPSQELTTKREIDLSKEHTFYVDASSSVSFDVELLLPNNFVSSGELTATIVGQSGDAG